MSNRGSCRRLWTVLYWPEAGSAESSTLPIPVHLWYGVQPLPDPGCQPRSTLELGEVNRYSGGR